MSDTWDEMRRAKEDQYFSKENEEALKRIKLRKAEDKPRLSPITGKPMKQVTLMGVVIDQCDDSGGIWLDRGELEQLNKAAAKQESSIFSNLFRGLIKE